MKCTPITAKLQKGSATSGYKTGTKVAPNGDKIKSPAKMKSKEDKPSNKEPKWLEKAEMNSESPAKKCMK